MIRTRPLWQIRSTQRIKGEKTDGRNVKEVLMRRRVRVKMKEENMVIWCKGEQGNDKR